MYNFVLFTRRQVSFVQSIDSTYSCSFLPIMPQHRAPPRTRLFLNNRSSLWTWVPFTRLCLHSSTFYLVSF